MFTMNCCEWLKSQLSDPVTGTLKMECNDLSNKMVELFPMPAQIVALVWVSDDLSVNQLCFTMIITTLAESKVASQMITLWVYV